MPENAITRKGIVVFCGPVELRVWIPENDSGYQSIFKLWPEGNFKEFGPPIGLGDVVEMKGDLISKIQDTQLNTVVKSLNGRKWIEVPVSFVPLFHSLFPGTAKGNNLVLALSNELGYLPIVGKNSYQKHRIYRGNAINFLEKIGSENKLARTYGTSWFLYDGAEPLDTNCVKDNFNFFTGLVLDASLDDAFMVYNEKTGFCSLRKEISQGIGLGDWIDFTYCDVQEAEKSDEQKEIFPENDEEMSYFDRRIAVHPIKLDKPPYKTKVVDGQQIEIELELDVPINPTHQGSYWTNLLGYLHDERGLIGVKMEGTKATVKIHAKTSIIDRSVEFILVEVTESEQISQPQELNNVFLENIQRGKKGPEKHHQKSNIAETSPKTERKSTSSDNLIPAALHQNGQQIQEPPSTDLVFFNGIVCLTDRLGNFVMVFGNDFSLPNSVVRLDRSNIDPLPKPGQWVTVSMQRVPGRGHRYIPRKAELLPKPVYPTSVAKNTQILMRVPLKVKDNGFLYNECIGLVNINRSLSLPPGYKRRTVVAWCTKIQQTEGSSYHKPHWELAQCMDAEWQEETRKEEPRSEETFQSQRTPLIAQTIGYIGSSYRMKQLRSPENS